MSSLSMKSKSALDRNSLHGLNISSGKALSASNILSINKTNLISSSSASHPEPARHASSMPTPIPAQSRATSFTPAAPSIKEMPVPVLQRPIQKGQKVPLFNKQNAPSLKASLGWNVLQAACDIDVSAFLLDEHEKVLGDSWFVFYGQPGSSDGSTHFSDSDPLCREAITINFKALNPAVQKIVFVLTINEAFEKKLNFSMVKDAYIKLTDAGTQAELASFKMTDYYNNVISMMIGEIYVHNDTWKFNAIGNGVTKDLAGLCSIYGVQIDD